MIYGKRITDGQSWKTYKSPKAIVRILDKSFQWKYTIYLCLVITLASLIFFIPGYYFIHQNYQIFIGLADKSDPLLYENLRRESNWIMGALIVSLIAIFLVTLFLGLRLTEAIVGPLIALERNMKKVTRGDLSMREFRTRSSDDFKDLTVTYSYLVKSLQAQTRQDLKWLEKIVIDPHNRDALDAWYDLIRTKEAQLGLVPKAHVNSTTLNFSAGSDAFRGTRRVS